ncbi:uncharacterized protein [Aquarana catesbeiana]|uniref:uncharacterized protein n=1 Tax=Aquarana catesbeiana TaxID=8400 RepID=UPI003CC9B494
MLAEKAWENFRNHKSMYRTGMPRLISTLQTIKEDEEAQFTTGAKHFSVYPTRIVHSKDLPSRHKTEEDEKKGMEKEKWENIRKWHEHEEKQQSARTLSDVLALANKIKKEEMEASLRKAEEDQQKEKERKKEEERKRKEDKEKQKEVKYLIKWSGLPKCQEAGSEKQKELVKCIHETVDLQCEMKKEMKGMKHMPNKYKIQRIEEKKKEKEWMKEEKYLKKKTEKYLAEVSKRAEIRKKIEEKRMKKLRKQGEEMKKKEIKETERARNAKQCTK